jgi:hypothetical protein
VRRLAAGHARHHDDTGQNHERADQQHGADVHDNGVLP